MQTASAPVQRILVIKLRHHGDMLLITPVINTLKANYPDAEVDVLLYQETAPMLSRHPGISHIFAMDRAWRKEGTCKRIGHEWRLLKSLRRRRYDLVVNLADQWYSAIVTRFTGARIRIGLDLRKRQSIFWKKCYTLLADTSQELTMHTVEQNLNGLTPLNLPVTDNHVTMACSEEDRQKTEQLLQRKQVTGDYIVVQPTSRWFYKCWDDDKMSEVIRTLADDGHQIVLSSGPDPREKAMIESILAPCQQAVADGKIVSVAGELTLPQLAALIDRAKLFIGVDSVPMHMAAALQTPMVALFGPTKLVFWSPWQATGEIIKASDYGELPDPDDVDTETDERYLSPIPANAVITAARRYL